MFLTAVVNFYHFFSSQLRSTEWQIGLVETYISVAVTFDRTDLRACNHICSKVNLSCFSSLIIFGLTTE